MHKKPFSAGAPPRTPLDELTMLPRPASRMGRGTPLGPFPYPSPSAPRSWRITLKLLPPPMNSLLHCRSGKRKSTCTASSLCSKVWNRHCCKRCQNERVWATHSSKWQP